MKNLPEKIYLVVGDIGDASDIDFNELSEVTWHSERIFPNDIEYVLNAKSSKADKSPQK